VRYPLASSSVEPVETRPSRSIAPDFSTAVLDRLEPSLEANGYGYGYGVDLYLLPNSVSTECHWSSAPLIPATGTRSLSP